MCLQSLSLYARTCAFNRPPIGGPIRVRVRVRVSVRVRVRVGVCVCVPPWTKGFPPPFLHKQGAGVPLQVSCQRRRLQLAVKPDLIRLAYLLSTH